MARTLRDRFEALVDRSGEHHIWTGATRPDTGVGRLKIDGKQVPAPQVAWELEHEPLDGATRVLPCTAVPACVRLDHLRLDARRNGSRASGTARRRGRKGGGSMREVAPGIWELAVTAGAYDDGRQRREYRRITASNRREAAAHLAAFNAEIQDQPAVVRRDPRALTFDDAVEQFLTEHLAAEKGRQPKTVDDYRRLHKRWFSPYVGRRRPGDVDEAVIDEAFGRMQRAGLSKSRLNQARSLYAHLDDLESAGYGEYRILFMNDTDTEDE